MTKLDDRIVRNRKKLQRHSPEDIGRAAALYSLAVSLRVKFLETDDVADLEEAIALHRSALDRRPAGHSDRSTSLHNLAICLSDRYNKQGTITDLEEATTLCRAALELRSPGHSRRAPTLYNLAICLSDRFLKFGANGDLDEAISLHRSALDLRPAGHSDRPDSLHNLAVCLSDRYNKQGPIADLEEAITLSRAALELRSPGHSDRALTLNNVANYLRDKFLKFGANGDLDEAISLHQAALDLRPAGHSNRSTSLHNLAVCFSDRYNKLGTIADLEEAITLRRTALELRPLGHSRRASTLCNLASDLRDRFLELDTDCDLDEAISLHRSALDIHPRDHHDHAKSIDKLLLLVRKRIQRHDMTADLDECISLGRSALASCEAGNPSHATYLHDLVTDLHSRFRKLENISDFEEAHLDHAISLHKLLIYFGDLVDDGDIAPVVDRVVAIVRVALKLCPTGHPNHVMSLTTLAAFLRCRFQQQGAVADLDEAILLYQEVLEVCPSGSVASAPHLHHLAQYLSERFTKLAMSTDLDDAIKFEQAALTLRPQGHPDRAESLNSLFDYRQLKIKGRGASTQSAGSTGTTSGSRFTSLIGDIVFDVLKGYPPRLLDTRTGMLCDRDSQIAQFERSGEYDQLLASASALDALARVTHIREVVSTYFRYVTLSHRWGKFEPLLRDIEGKVIYDLDLTGGLGKLQSFCLTSFRSGYLWAWSDTCCIDKESSAELQEAIGSMFSWYRLSALTMVHLADVSDTGGLTSSVWLKRGWTLQELLAPHTMLFFTRDWSLYRDSSSNHKDDSAILGELEQVTGITSQHLTNFHPGVDDARSRLQWASTRCTTRPEDIAYSLFGVFSLHIPVLYGESAENALGRLLAEVISKSGDTSILDWVGQSSVFHSCFPATITPYQTLPLSLPNLTTPPPARRIRKLFFLGSARKMHQALSNLPRAKFANFRLILPCIVHRIKAMTLTRVDTSTATLVHQMQAVGLAPIDIALSERLENVEKGVPYALIRPWHPSLLHPAVDTDDASTHQWLTRLVQPFSALLLMELPHKEYRRVASFCHIIARPTDFAGVLKGEVHTLTII